MEMHIISMSAVGVEQIVQCARSSEELPVAWQRLLREHKISVEPYRWAELKLPEGILALSVYNNIVLPHTVCFYVQYFQWVELNVAKDSFTVTILIAYLLGTCLYNAVFLTCYLFWKVPFGE